MPNLRLSLREPLQRIHARAAFAHPRINPSPVILLNRAVAIGMSEGAERGIQLIDELGVSGALDDYHLLHAARADFYRRLGRLDAAATSYRRALTLATNSIEGKFLEQRLAQIVSRES
jgi:RNA polymerase sigma-70 factor, ECF subfamily